MEGSTGVECRGGLDPSTATMVKSLKTAVVSPVKKPDADYNQFYNFQPV